MSRRYLRNIYEGVNKGFFGVLWDIHPEVKSGVSRLKMDGDF